jgi:LPXTG-site transpeptidase (sortase) family protein
MRSALRHRRLLPAVPLFLAAAVVAIVAGDRLLGARAEDPPAKRPLPNSALSAEHGGPSAATGAPTDDARRRRLVDVVDAQAPTPRRIEIPAIGVSAPVIALGLDPDRTMETPKDYADAGWYEPGPEPGERGAAVIVGHVDSKSGAAVFYRLRELRRGDVIRVARAGGSTVRFRVEGLERWPKSAFPTRRVFRRTRLSTLRLVTCSGNFDPSTGHYEDNTIVYAVREPVRRRARP